MRSSSLACSNFSASFPNKHFHNVVFMKSNILINLVSRLEFRSRTKYRSITRIPTSFPRSRSLDYLNEMSLDSSNIFNMYTKLDQVWLTYSGVLVLLIHDFDCTVRFQKTVVQKCSKILHPYHGSMAYQVYSFSVTWSIIAKILEEIIPDSRQWINLLLLWLQLNNYNQNIFVPNGVRPKTWHMSFLT